MRIHSIHRRARRQEEAGILASLHWGVIAVVVPAFSYLFAYSYLLGQAHHYGIPYEFISVGLSDVLEVGLLVGGLFLWYGLAFAGLMDRIQLHPGVAALLGPVGASLLFAGLYWWSEGSDRLLGFWLSLAALTAIGAVLVLIVQSLRHGGIPNALNQIAQDDLNDPAPWSKRVWMRVIRRAVQLRPAAILMSLLAVLILSLFAMALGSGQARLRGTYAVRAAAPHQVVVMVFDRTAVVGTVDKDQQLTGSFSIQAVDTLGRLKIQRTGRLTPQGT